MLFEGSSDQPKHPQVSLSGLLGLLRLWLWLFLLLYLLLELEVELTSDVLSIAVALLWLGRLLGTITGEILHLVSGLVICVCRIWCIHIWLVLLYLLIDVLLVHPPLLFLPFPLVLASAALLLRVV